ncbi:MAG: WYL domain-containing protein, partial [Myxococcaceae bacterium]
AVTDRTFEPPAPERGSVPNPVGDSGQVRVRFSKVAAPYVMERFGATARPLADGGVDVFVTADQAWITQWVLSFGGEAEVVAPPEFRAAVEKAARSVLP